jgi:outer membrane protein assembly factor BamB
MFGAVCQDARAESFDCGALLRGMGVERGIVAQLGVSDGANPVAMTTDDDLVIQILERDPEKVATARRQIQAQEACGRVSIRRLDADRLPYLDNLFNLLVVVNPLDVSEREMMRVVRPLGVAMIRQADSWRRVVKPWPEDLDEWTHFLHDATGNAVSADAHVGPPRRLRWSAGPMWGRSHETNNSYPALVTARGKMFYVFDKGLTGMEDPRLPERWTLIARDAFNGTLLWERPLTTWGSDVWQTRALRFFGGGMARRLVADGDRLYVTLQYGGGVQILDAATGATIGEIPGTVGAEEVLVADPHVVVASREQQQRSGAASAISCYDMASQKVLWRVEDKGFLSQLVTVGPDAVVYHNKNGVICLNRDDGTVRWTYADEAGGGRGNAKMLLLADNKVVLSSRKQITALSIVDGQVAWQAPGVEGQSMREQDLFCARGKVWCSGANGTIVGYDIRDGSPTESMDVSSVQSQGHHLRCYRAKATEDYLITQFRGVEFLSLDDQGHSQNDWVRGTCTYGVMPANGLLYVPPHSCLCYSAAMVKGLNAFAADSDDERAGAARQLAAGPVERGPAFAAGDRYAAPSNQSWPSYRHDGRRTGATTSELRGTLQRQWKVNLDGELTPPTSADGRVFVAVRDRHSVYALAGSNGERLWHFVADARVDSPPSIRGNRVLFGCADGFLYCLRAEDGQLVWRRRLAPDERWLCVDGQLESVWRLHGSVLLEGDLAYCCAGRSSYLDEGLFLYAVDIQSGDIRHRARLSTASKTREEGAGTEFVASYHIEGAHSDILVAQGGFIYLNQMKFSPDLKLQPAKYLTKEEITARPSMNLDNKDYVNEDIFRVKWRGEQMSTYDQLAGILVNENKNVGERELGLHLFTTSGFLDTSFFNRTYWMYSETWTGFNHANLAPKSGQILVVGPETTYALKAYTSRYPLSPKLDPQTKGYLLIADDNHNEPTLDPRAWGKDKGMGFSRGAPPLWHRWLPVRVNAMVLAGERLIVCGPPDVVQDGDPMAAFEGRLGSRIWTLSATDGQVESRQEIDELPVFDGLIAADDRLFLCTERGDVICMTGQGVN